MAGLDIEQTPNFPLRLTGEVFFRAKVGSGKQVIITYVGHDEISPREIQKLIDLLIAQKVALETL